MKTTTPREQFFAARAAFAAAKYTVNVATDEDRVAFVEAYYKYKEARYAWDGYLEWEKARRELDK